jgi:hypothetical protein
MATGLFHRRTPDGRAAGDHGTPGDTTTTDTTTTDATASDRRVAGTAEPTIPRRRLATDQPVRPGGAVAPDGAVAPVPPGGAVAPPTDATRPIDTGLAPPLTERDRAETVAERERLDTAETAEPVRWARTSFTATLSLIIGVCATLAALSGRLAPLAVAVGVVGLVFAALALTAVSRRHVTGHHVALLGLAFSIAGVVFGILAINRSLPWLDGGADQAAQLRGWLDSHWSWLGRW